MFFDFLQIKNHWLSHWHWPCCVIWSQAHPWAIAEPGRSRCPCWSRGQSLWVFTGSKFPFAGCWEKPWPWKTVLPSFVMFVCFAKDYKNTFTIINILKHVGPGPKPEKSMAVLSTECPWLVLLFQGRLGHFFIENDNGLGPCSLGHLNLQVLGANES